MNRLTVYPSFLTVLLTLDGIEANRINFETLDDLESYIRVVKQEIKPLQVMRAKTGGIN